MGGYSGVLFRQQVPFYSVADAVKEFFTAVVLLFLSPQIDCPATNRRRAVDFVAELILGEQFELLRRCLENINFSVDVRRVNPVADHYRRPINITAQPL